MIPTEPYWQRAARPELPAYRGQDVRADVAVIGAGLSGLSAAYHLLLLRPGLRVVVLEAERLGAGASGRTTGMLGPGVGQSLPALVRRLGEKPARALYEATLAAVSYVGALIEREGIECELKLSGQLMVARSFRGDRGGRRRLAATAELMRRLELPVEALDDDALSATLRLRAPGDREHPALGPAALRLPLAGTLHPVKLVAGLAQRVLSRGGIIYEQARVRSIHVNDAGKGRCVGPRIHLPVCGAEQAEGRVTAEKVVVATAGYTKALGILRGRILPVHLQALCTEPLDEEARAAIGWRGEEGLLDARRLFSYCRLTADRRIIFGGCAPRYYFGGRAAAPCQAEAAALDELAAELHSTFPSAAHLVVAGGWTGVIGYVLDALPAIAALPGCPQIVHAVGWCGHGVALGTASGKWVAQLLCEGAPSDDVRELSWFRASVPGVPTEFLRWAGFSAAVRWMALQDRLA
jgi:gamma-glutamylputrescine oxidase